MTDFAAGMDNEPVSEQTQNPNGGYIDAISAAREQNLDERGIPKNLGPQFRAMQRTGYDEAKHTVEMALSSDKPVDRWYGTEILSHDPAHIRQARLKQGIPLLFNHDMDQHLGVSTGYEIDGGTLRTTSRFGSNPLALEKELDVRTEILKDNSVGYMVYEWEITEDKNGVRTMKAIDWEPFEGSLVTVPADAKGSGVGRNTGEGEVPVKYSFRKLDETADSEASDDDDSEDDDDEDDENDAGSESERTTTPAAQRIIMAEQTVDLAAANKTRIEGLRSLLKSNPKEFPADEFARSVAEDVTVASAKEAVADKIIANSQRSNVNTLGDDVMDAMSAKEQRSYSLRNVYCAAINQRAPGTFKDKESEAGLEREVSDTLRKGASERGITGFGSGIVIPSATTRSLVAGAQQRAIAAGGNAGTATNFTVVVPDPIELLRSKTVTLALGARMMTGLHGALKMPRQNAAGQSNWLAEGGGVVNTDPTLDAIGMTPHRLSMFNSYYLEFLAQSALAVDSFLSEDRMAVLARSLDFAGLAGPGTGNSPLGLTNQTGLAAILSGTTRNANGTVTAGAGGVPLTYVDCNNFEAAIATANGDIGTLGWALTPKVRAALRSTPKITSGLSDFIWPSVSGQGANGIQEGPLGYRAIASTAVPTGFTVNAVAGLHAVILGVWDQMLFGDWGLSEVIVDPYTGAQQGLYKVTEHALYDTNIRHIEAFALSTSVLPS